MAKRRGFQVAYAPNGFASLHFPAPSGRVLGKLHGGGTRTVVGAHIDERCGSAVQPPLRLTTTSTGILWRTAVSSSMALSPNEPSPCTQITCLSGLAPSAKGRPTSAA
jgi:hypothetical protein